MKKKILLYLFLLITSLQNTLASSIKLNLIEVAPNIFVHQGKHFDVDENCIFTALEVLSETIELYFNQ